MQQTPTNPDTEYERPKVSLSCLQCQRRKKKCDKNSPCQACTQAGISCTAISRARLPRGRHASQRDNEDLRRRVSRLEELLLSQKNDGAPRKVTPQSEDLSKTLSDSAWTSISEEVFGIRELVDSLAEDEPGAHPVETVEREPMQRFETLFYSDTSHLLGPDVLLPPPESVVMSLIDIYLHRVDPLFKVVHGPSLRELFSQDLNTITLPQKALKSSVLFAAVSSLDEQECLQFLGSGKGSLSSRLQLASEISLSGAKLLTSTDLTALQAFVIYLAGIRASCGCRAVCLMLATAVRIGQCLGLDIEKTKHSPFETEMRRRIWYSIGILDLQASFDIGSYSALAGGPFFRNPPLHINDADISPHDLKPPPGRQCFTDMTFCSATHDMLRYMKKMIHVPLDVEGHPLMQQSLTERHGFVEECAQVLQEKWLRYCGRDDSFQLFTRIVCESMITTMRLLIRRPMYSFYSVAPPPDDNFNVLDVATEILEQTFMKSENSAFKPWQWFSWIKWYALAISFAELINHTKGTNTDRAWNIAEISFVRMKGTIRDDILWKSLEKLMQKAQNARKLNNSTPESDNGFKAFDFQSGINGGVDLDFGQGTPITNGFQQSQEEGLLGEMDMLSWNNWQLFVQDLGDPLRLDRSNGYYEV